MAADCSTGFILDLDVRLLTAGGGAVLGPDEVSITLLPGAGGAEAWAALESSWLGGSGVASRKERTKNIYQVHM